MADLKEADVRRRGRGCHGGAPEDRAASPNRARKSKERTLVGVAPICDIGNWNVDSDGLCDGNTQVSTKPLNGDSNLVIEIR